MPRCSCVPKSVAESVAGTRYEKPATSLQHDVNPSTTATSIAKIIVKPRKREAGSEKRAAIRWLGFRQASAAQPASRWRCLHPP
jgi:hypothetical protein